MLHTPLKHLHPSPVVVHGHGHAHAHAQHAQAASTRCTPHVVHATLPHELNLADWLHMSPAQVAMMSPVAVPYTPPHHLFVPTPSPLQYAAVANANARNDFLNTSPLPYSSPFHLPASSYQIPYAENSDFQHTQMQVDVPSISIESMQQLQGSLAATAHTGNTSSPGLSSEYFPFAGAATSTLSTSPISHRASPFPFLQHSVPNGQGESTPVTTLSASDESQAQVSSQENGPSQPLIDRLRGASPITDAGSNSRFASPERPRAKPLDSLESPFRIAAPQPRPGSGPFSPLPPSSRPASALGALSELAELASRQSTPSHHLVTTHSHSSSRAVSRPTSALSFRSTASHTRGASKVRRKQHVPHRFASSLLHVSLPSTSGGDGKGISPSVVDALPRGPLEFEEEGNRYRTRSKLRNFKAEIQEREREADLLLIRRGLRGEDASGDAEDKSGLDMLASVSATRRIDVESPPARMRSATPLAVRKQAQKGKAVRPKKAVKRAFRDLDDADCESVTTASESGCRTPSKKQRVPALVHEKKEHQPTRLLRSRTTRGSSNNLPTRPSPVRTSSQSRRKDTTPPKPTRATATAGAQKEDARIEDQIESDLSSLSSLSETEDTDYLPKKGASRPKASSASSAAAKGKTTPSCMQIDTAGGAAAIPMPVRTFPPDVPLHAAFPLLYRKFPVCSYIDPSLTGSKEDEDEDGNENEDKDKDENDENDCPPMPPAPSSGHFNAPRTAEDLYTPRFVRGIGRDKMGLCPICYESTERGGAGRAEWLSMKFSAFNYHMQYAHGISPITALPFSPPLAFRVAPRTTNHKNEKVEMLEGKCHRCQEWAPVEGVKCVEAKLKEIYWWKHAAACHKGSTISGECDIHLEDAVATRVKKAFEVVEARTNLTVPALHTIGKPFTTATARKI